MGGIMVSRTLAFALVNISYLLCFSVSARAEVVQYVFEGTVINRFNNGLADPSDIFGLSVNVGDSVVGYFSLDTSAPVFATASGPVAGSAKGYTQSSPQEIRINLGGGVFASDGDFVSSTVNDYDDGSIFPTFDSFTVNDGVASGSTNLTGDTIRLNDGLETAKLSVDFRDDDATVLDSTALPTSLNADSFELASGTINGTRPSGQLNPYSYYVSFSVDSVSVMAVPEPSSFPLLLLVGYLTATQRRKR